MKNTGHVSGSSRKPARMELVASGDVFGGHQEPESHMHPPANQDLSIESETSLLGALLIPCSTSWPPDVETLRPGHFSSLTRAKVFAAMLELRARNEQVDQLTVHGALRDQAKPPKAGWATYLAGLCGAVPTAANVDHYARLVLRESRRRDYVSVMSGAVCDAREVGADADAIATTAALRLGEIADGREIMRPVMIHEALKSELADLDERRRSGTPVGHSTGFKELDRIMCGLVPGHMILIAARPSMGKSSLVRNMLVRMSLRGLGVLLFSLEMSREEIAQAAVASESRVNLQAIRTARLTTDQYDKVVGSMATMHASKMAIVDKPEMQIAEIRSISRAFASRNTLHAVAVDYVQLARGDGSNREQEIASISRGLKALAKELRVPVIGLSQLNRGLESRDDKRPRLSDLRESGSLEQDADEVLFLYRDDYYNQQSSKAGIAEVGVAKNRNGPTGMIELAWLGRFTRFESLVDNRELEITG